MRQLLLTSAGVRNPVIRTALLDCPSYAIEDETAIRVVDGVVGVVSEGHWRHFEAPTGVVGSAGV